MEASANAKFEQEIKKTYEGVVEKARSLLRLQVPAQYKRSNKTMESLKSAFSLKLK